MFPKERNDHVSFCLMKKERRWDSCQAQVAPRTTSWRAIQRMTRALVDSDWSLNSASRSWRGSQLATIEAIYICIEYEYWTHPLEDLLALDIVQARVEVLDALGDVLQLALVGALDLAGLADGEVEGELDAAVGVGGVEPALAAAVTAGREAEAVVAGLVRGEGEAARRGAALGDDSVVVVEDFLFHGEL